MRTLFRRAWTIGLIAVWALPAWAEVAVSDAWVRGTVPSQKVTGAFFTVQSAKGGAIVGAASPVSERVELHEMRMEGDVARMRQIDTLPLPAGRPLELRPGGYHLMLMGLKQPLAAGDQVPLRLEIDPGDGQLQVIEVQATVQALGAAAHESHGHHEHHGHHAH